MHRTIQTFQMTVMMIILKPNILLHKLKNDNLPATRNEFI